MGICMLLGLKGKKSNDIVNILAFKNSELHDYVEILETEFQKNDLFCNPKEKTRCS